MVYFPSTYRKLYPHYKAVVRITISTRELQCSFKRNIRQLCFTQLSAQSEKKKRPFPSTRTLVSPQNKPCTTGTKSNPYDLTFTGQQ